MIDFDPIKHKYSMGDQSYWSVTQMITGLKLSPPYPTEDLNNKKELGSAVHKAVDLAAWDRLDHARTHQDLIPYVAGFEEKKREMLIRPIATELRMWDERLCIAGTLDIFGWIYDDELAVIDYKSGSAPNCTELQTALYVKLLLYHAERHNADLFRAMNGLQKNIRRFSMKLTPGRAIVKEYRDVADFAAADGAVALFKWIADRRKDINI